MCTIGDNANKARISKQVEMDVDHVTAWSKGEATHLANCEMLCSTHSRAQATNRTTGFTDETLKSGRVPSPLEQPGAARTCTCSPWGPKRTSSWTGPAVSPAIFLRNHDRQ